jgi:hypothetical protein
MLFRINNRGVSLLFTLVLMYAVIPAVAQNKVEKLLNEAGFENVRHISKPGKEIIFLENNSYSNNQKAIDVAQEEIRLLRKEFNSSNIEVILLEEKIPVLRMYTTFSEETINPIWTSDFVFDEGIHEIKSLKGSLFEYKSTGKIDFKLYPVFRFKNSSLRVMYLLQFNINPTLEVSLWRGAKATAQVIFPVVNDYSIEEGRIRPGFITLSQQFRLPSNFYGMITVGNFNMFRAGVDVKIFKSISKKIGLFAQASYTTYSVPMFNDWFYSSINKFTWKVGASYVYKPLKIIINASINKFLANDICVRGEITRYFRNSAVGFYVQSMAIPDYPINGGFFFAFSLPPYKHKRNTFVRVSAGDYFSLEYIARPYNEYGRYFTTSPEDNSSYNFFNRIHLNQLFDN